MISSALSEDLNPGCLLKFGANQPKPQLPEQLEWADNAPFPNAAVTPSGYQVALHHSVELLAPVLTVLGKIVTWEAFPNLFVVARNEKADVTQAVVHAG
jgi:hypothetical protein